MKNATGCYLQSETLGKSQIDLILQVYDGATRSYELGRQHYEKGDDGLGYEELEKGKRFIMHLYTTLDHKQGGEEAKNLANLYAFIVSETNTIQASKDREKLLSIIDVIRNVRSGWAGLKDNPDLKNDQTRESVVRNAVIDSFVTTA